MMSGKDYEALLETSSVFHSLSTDFKKTIVTSKGEERERYEHIFGVESEGMQKARQQFAERNAVVVRDLKYEVKTIGRDYVQTQESKATKSDEAAGKNLLDQLDKL